MEKETRQRLERLTQQARRLLEQEFREQLEGRYDILLDGRISLAPGPHLSPRERVLRDKLVAAVAHKRSQGITAAAAVAAYLREAAFHTLNRFVALKMLEARKLVQECISRGEESAGFKEFIALAPGLVALPDKGYRLYVETIFDEIAQEVRALFDRRDAATLLWPRRQALLDLLSALNDPEVASVWREDETIGWVYQYFNGEDERRQMRAESPAPRNSRELAVRNQFFTPRYVVQFLTDNSLGRTWCEMRGADTQLSQLDYLVKPEEGFETRVPKDPRDLRILDPACGSGHFLLYAFDLLAGDPTRSFLGIYEEAWRAEAAPKSEVTGRTLKEDYDNELALRRAVPELILKHNLHGVDIDPRAAQIAGLALWMRAQRAYNDHKVAAQDRPLMGRTNIVTAEPMPGDGSMVAEFASTLRPRVLGELFQRMVEEMRLAGELGSLLKINRVLKSAVAKAREQFINEKREPQKFLPGFERPRSPQLEFDLSGVSDESFFDAAEERIVKALQEYAAGAPASLSVRRQLFADDAAQGIAFIDLCRKHFDVVLMNPPFGQPTARAGAYLRDEGSDGWKDIYAGFFEVAAGLALSTGYVAAITSSQYFHTRQLRGLRERWVKERRIGCLVDLGAGVLDGAAVQTALAILGPRGTDQLTYLDLLEDPDKAEKLLLAAQASQFSSLSLDDLEVVPGMPFCLHASPNILHQWRIDEPFDPHSGTVATGNHTFDDERFLRLRFEVAERNVDAEWRTFEKGGEYQPFFSAPQLLLQWRDDGKELRVLNAEKYGSDAQVMQSSRLWGRRGICYTHVSSVGFSPRFLPQGIVFSSESIGVFPELKEGDPTRQLLGLLGFLASTAAQELVWVFGRYRKIENRAVSGLPISLNRLEPHLDQLSDLAQQALLCVIEMDSFDETKAVFRAPDALVDNSLDGTRRAEIAAQLESIYVALDQCVETILGLSDRDITAPRRASLVPNFCINKLARNPSERAADVIMWAMGRAFDRWSKSESVPEIPDPVSNPLPVSPPASRDINREVPESILVDDEGHSRDVCTKILSELEIECAETLVNAVLGALEGGALRNWLRHSFLDFHVRRYTSLKRRAPIYWQLATTSGSYSVWIYIHRATGDTLFRVLSDFVGPKLDHEKTKLDGLSQDAGANPSAAQRREIEQQETFVGELQALKTEVARVAQLWKPNLNDGVILNFAPLWRLVPQSRSWQGECKKAWDKLVAGDYDWAHLAMHLWPERVVPKCIDDRSLAIAHGLEEVFWHEDDSATWRKSRVDDATVQKLIQERTSTTVKAALKDLLSAAAPTASKGRKAKGRSASPRNSAPKPTPAAARATTPDTALDEATLLAVKAVIARVADGASKADVLAATGLSDSVWNQAIATLLDRGDVTRTGQKRGTRYHADSPGVDG